MFFSFVHTFADSSSFATFQCLEECGQMWTADFRSLLNSLKSWHRKLAEQFDSAGVEPWRPNPSRLGRRT